MSHPSHSKADEVHYTVFVRVPFPRDDFVDPPAVQWNASKDQALWKILSSSSRDTEIDWNILADRFEVTLSFLLQQAAWLYEKQLFQVREQLRKVNKPTSARSSPAPDSISGSTNAGGYAMRRGGSGGSRVPSSLSVRARDSPVARSEEPNTPDRSKRPTAMRIPSTNSVSQAQSLPIRTTPNQQRRSLEEAYGRDGSSDRHQNTSLPRSPSPIASSSSTSSSSSSGLPTMAHSRAFTRRPRFSAQKAKGKTKLDPLIAANDEDDDADDDSPAFLPLADPSSADVAHSLQDPSATLRRLPSNPSRRDSRLDPIMTESASHTPAVKPGLVTQITMHTKTQPATKTTHSSSSSLSSPFPASNAQSRTLSSPNPGPASPTGPLSALSPRTRRIAREGSEGTPSMGSSFSDLDDTSITKSAMEEQMAKEIREAGSLGVVSRMGGLWTGRAAGRFGG
ncbi:hypothetical protein MMC13_002139 [Lambiella insularis]|nr:hypothetical protein [Lambiella insularis]